MYGCNPYRGCMQLHRLPPPCSARQSCLGDSGRAPCWLSLENEECVLGEQKCAPRGVNRKRQTFELGAEVSAKIRCCVGPTPATVCSVNVRKRGKLGTGVLLFGICGAKNTAGSLFSEGSVLRVVLKPISGCYFTHVGPFRHIFAERQARRVSFAGRIKGSRSNYYYCTFIEKHKSNITSLHLYCTLSATIRNEFVVFQVISEIFYVFSWFIK